MKKWILGALIIASALFAETPEIEIGKPIPKFGGTSVNTKEWITPKKWADSSYVIAISFGVTWCIPCAQELPFLDSLRTQNPKLKTLSILVDEKNTQALPFAQKLKLTMPVLFDFGQILSKRFGVGTDLPHLILVDSKGIVRNVKKGFSVAHKDSLKQEILGYLQGK